MKRIVVLLSALCFLGCKRADVKEGDDAKQKTDTTYLQSNPEEESEKVEGEMPDVTLPVEMGWKSVTVDSDGETGYYNSLSHGVDGSLAIAYYDNTNRDLKCALYGKHLDAMSWRIEVVDSLGDVGVRPSVDHNSAGEPAISYYDATNRNLKYAFYRDGQWIVETVDDGSNVGMYSSLIHNPEGRPAISYYDRSNADLKFAVRGESGWRISVVDSEGRVGLYSCLSYDRDGVPVISYEDGAKGALKCAVRYDNEWYCVVVDEGIDPNNSNALINKADLGSRSSLACDVKGRIHIVYFDTTNTALKYAVYDDTLQHMKYDPKPGEHWKVDTIDCIDDPGHVGALHLIKDEHLAISCTDWKEKLLLYITREEEAWEREPIYPAGLVDEITSLSHGPNGHAAISCYSATNKELKLISWAIVQKKETEE